MYQRINVTLASETLKQVDEYAPKGDRTTISAQLTNNDYRTYASVTK